MEKPTRLQYSVISKDLYIASAIDIRKDLQDVALASNADMHWEVRDLNQENEVVGVFRMTDIKEPFSLLSGLVAQSGYGKLMLDWIKKHASDSILITVTGDNRKLQNYYKKQGFRKLTKAGKNILMINDKKGE